MALLPTPFSYQQATGDGSKTDFTFAFEYLLRDHIKVFLDDTEVAQGSAANQWDWIDNTSIKMGTAPTAAQTLTIRRITPEDKQMVPWNDGSYLIAEDLNTSDLQWLFLIQEHHDMLMRIVWGLDPLPGPDLPDDLFTFWNNLARNKDSNKGTANEKAQTIDSVDQLAGDATAPQNGIDAYVMTLGAISSRLDVVVGNGAGYPGAGNVGQQGKLRVDNTVVPNKLFYWDTGSTAWVEIKGVSGTAATVDVGTTTTLDAGQNATVTNSGTTSAAVFDFGIPKGEKGDPGDGVEYKGPIDPTTTAPTGFTNGDFWVSTAAGTAVAEWTGLTVVAVNDRLIWNGNTSQFDRYSQAWIQSDWDETDAAAPAFIQNKPNIGTGFVKLNDGGTQQQMQSKGLAIGLPIGDPQTGFDKLWNFEILPGGTRPQTWFKSQAASGAHDVRIGDDINAASPWIGNNAKGHGIFLNSGDVSIGNELNPPRLTIQSSTKAANVDTAFLLNGGHLGGTPKKAIEFFYDGSAEFQRRVKAGGDFTITETNGSVKLSLNGASEHYEYEFPPAGPANGNNWTLMCDISNNSLKADMRWKQAFTEDSGDVRYLRKNNVPGVSTGQGGGDTMVGQLTLGAADINTGSSIVATARAVPNNTAWSLGATNVWTIAANSTVLFPLDTNASIGPPENQCGIFVLLGDGISWTDTDANRGWRFPGGTVIGGTAGKTAIVPFIVTAQDGLNDVVINLGNPTVCEAQ